MKAIITQIHGPTAERNVRLPAGGNSGPQDRGGI